MMSLERWVIPGLDRSWGKVRRKMEYFKRIDGTRDEVRDDDERWANIKSDHEMS